MKVKFIDILKDIRSSNCGVYCITNESNGKIYIGISTNLRKRAIKHSNSLRKNKHHNLHLQSAYNRDSVESFTFQILEEFPKDTSDYELLKRENHYQQLYKSIDPSFGYNILITDINGKLRHTEQHKQFISNIMSNVPKTEICKQRIAETLTGRSGTPHTQEHKDYMSRCLKGRPKSKEHREKLSIAKKGIACPNKGKKLGPIHSIEGKALMSMKRSGSLNPRSVKIIDSDNNIYLTIKEVCEKMNLCRTTVEKYIKNGILRRV
jgi:group I intron endonuclease